MSLALALVLALGEALEVLEGLGGVVEELPDGEGRGCGCGSGCGPSERPCMGALDGGSEGAVGCSVYSCCGGSECACAFSSVEIENVVPSAEVNEGLESWMRTAHLASRFWRNLRQHHALA